MFCRKLLERGCPFLIDLPFANHLDRLDPRRSCGRKMEGLEALHWPRDPLDEAVIPLQDSCCVIQVECKRYHL